MPDDPEQDPGPDPYPNQRDLTVDPPRNGEVFAPAPPPGASTADIDALPPPPPHPRARSSGAPASALAAPAPTPAMAAVMAPAPDGRLAPVPAGGDAAAVAPVAPVSDEKYGDIVQGLVAGQQAPLRQAINQADSVTPAQAAEARGYAVQFGVPISVVQRDLGRYRHRAGADQPIAAIQAQSPKLADWLTDPANAQVAQGDLPHLGLLNWLLQYPSRGVARDLTQMNLSALRTKAIFQPLSQADQDLANSYQAALTLDGDLGVGDSWFRAAVAGLVNVGTFLGNTGPEAIGGAVAGGVVGGIGGSIVPGAGTIAGIAAGAELGWEGGKALGLARVAFTTAAGPAYDHLRTLTDEHGQPLPDGVARVAAVGVGTLNALLMGITLPGLPGVETLTKFPGGALLTPVLAQRAVAQALKAPTVQAGLAALASRTAKGALHGSALMVGMQAIDLMGGELAKGIANVTGQRGVVPGQLNPGNIDLTQGPVDPITVAVGDQQLVLPQVPGGDADGHAALAAYKATGQQLGQFETPDAAEAYSAALRADQAAGRHSPDDGPGFAHTTPSAVKDSLLETAATSLRDFSLVSLLGAGVEGVADVQRAYRARHNAAFLAALGDVLDASSTQKASPSAMESLVAHLTQDGPLKDVYVDTPFWETFWQTQHVDPARMAAEVTGDPEAWRRAQTDGTLKLSLARYAATVGKVPEHFAAFAPELRMGPDGPDAANGREVTELQARLKAEHATRAAAVVPDAEAPVSTIRAYMIGKLTGIVDRRQAETAADLFESLTLADREELGVETAARLTAYGFDITKEVAARKRTTSTVDRTAAPAQTAEGTIHGEDAAAGVPVEGRPEGGSGLRDGAPQLAGTTEEGRAVEGGGDPDGRAHGGVSPAGRGSDGAPADGLDTADPASRPPGQARFADADTARAHRDAERARFPAPPDGTERFERRAAGDADTARRLTPDVVDHLRRILEELAIEPFTGHTFTEVEGKQDGNFAGGHQNKVSGHGNADVYKDIQLFSPVNTNSRTGEAARDVHGTGGQMRAAIQHTLETGEVKTNLAEGALRVAERRAAGHTKDLHTPGLPPLDPLPGSGADAVRYLKRLSDAHEAIDAPPDPRASDSTADFMDGRSVGPDELQSDQPDDTSWNTDEFHQSLFDALEAPTVVDTLDTGEEQPRLPGAEQVRDQDVATPQLEAPFSLTAEVDTTRRGQQDTLFQSAVGLTGHDVDTWVAHVRARAGDGLARLDVSLDANGDLSLNRLAVVRALARPGLGTTVLRELTRFADCHGRRVTVNLAHTGVQPASDVATTTASTRLEDFYSRFGFVSNRGHTVDYSVRASLYRDPTVPTPGGIDTFHQSAPDAVPPAPAWFSRLTRAVDASKQTKANGAQWKATIRQSKSGIDQGEYAITRVDDLQDGKSYTRQEVLEYLAVNAVHVEEATLQDPPAPTNRERDDEVDRHLQRLEQEREDGRGADAPPWHPRDDLDLAMEANAAADQVFQDRANAARPDTYAGPPRFEGYTLPGFDPGSYREVFLTSPPTTDDAQASWRDGHADYDDVQNPIVRLRLNTRTAASGERVLFLEEVQPPHADQQKKMPALFVKHWRALAFKWALRQAGEMGLDAVAWTTGKQQADRYALGHEVSSIHYSPESEQLAAYGHNGQEVMREYDVKPDQIGAHIGKDAAATLLERPLTDRGRGMSAAHVLEGEGLRLGGEGLRQLYDVDFKRVVEGLPTVKRLGGRVEPLRIGAPEGRSDKDVATELAGVRFDIEQSRDRIRRLQDDTADQDEAALEVRRAQFRALQDERHALFVRHTDLIDEQRAAKQQPGFDAPSVRLTPELRDAVRGGQALFQSEPAEPKLVATLTGSELGEGLEDIKDLRRAAIDHYQREFQHTLKWVDRPGFGRIAFTKAGRDHLEAFSADPDVLRVVPALPTILTEGVYRGREATYKPRRDEMVAFHTFEADVKLGDRTRHATVKVGEDRYGNKFYDLQLPTEKAPLHRGRESTAPEPPEDDGKTTLTQSIHPDRGDVNLTLLEQDPPAGPTAPGTGPRGVIRFGAGRQISMEMLAKADRSTFFHETGHLFLEMFADSADRMRALEGPRSARQQQLLDDYDATVARLGGETRNPLTGTHFGKDAHEQWAQEFEQYLFNGVAPSLPLRAAFARMRVWLSKVYRSVRGLNIELSPEVKGVFDRMLASDDAIAEADAQRGPQQLFTTAASAGMSEAEFANYRETVAQAGQNAREQLDQRLFAEVTREQTAEWRDAEATMTTEVTAQVDQAPLYRAVAAITDGTHPDGTPLVEGETPTPLRLDRARAIATYGAERIAALPRDLFTSERTGVEADHLAEPYGFSSGDALLRAIAQTPTRDAAIAEQVAQRMAAEHGSLLVDHPRLIAAAKAALANTDRERIIRAEMRALRKLQREVKPFVDVAKAESRDGQGRLEAQQLRATARGGAVTINAGLPPDAVLRQAARTRIASLTLRQLKPEEFWSNARRAAKSAIEHAARQHFEAAITSKSQELLQVAFYREAVRVQDDVTARLTAVQRYTTTASQRRISLAKLGIQAQVQATLERFGFVAATRTVHPAIGDWIKSLEETGYAVDLPDILTATTNTRPYKGLTVTEFVDVTDGVKMIAHLAQLENRLLKAQRHETLSETATTLATSIRDHFQGTPPTPARDRSDNPAVARFNDFVASHVRLSDWAREMDGGEDGGPVATAFNFRLNDAGAAQASMTADATRRLGALVEAAYPRSEKRELFQKREVPAVNGSLSKMERISVALNWGNEGNRERQRLYEHWSDDQVRAVLDTLDARDLTFVQGVLDLINSYKEQIVAKQERVYGVAPAMVDPVPIEAAAGTIPGGYYPLKYDARLSPRAGSFLDLDTGLLAKQAAYANATTARGHTKERLSNVQLPIRRDFGVIYEHLGQVIHDLTHHEALIDVQRLLTHPEVSSAIYETHGAHVYNAIKSTVRDIAFGPARAQEGVERALGFVRSGAAVAGLGWSLTVPLLHLSGALPKAIVRIGPRWFGAGLVHFLRDAASMESSAAWIDANSPTMANRFLTRDRELNDIRNQVGVHTGRFSGWVAEAIHGVSLGLVEKQDLVDSYFYLVGQSQKLADIPTYLGQFEKSRAAGESETRAHAIAAQSVLDAFGGGQIKDLPPVMRGTAALKLWTTFYGPFNSSFNLLRSSVRGTTWDQPASIGRLAVDTLLLVTAGALMGDAIRSGIKPASANDDPEEGWDATRIGEYLIKAHLGYLADMMVGTRELAGAIHGYHSWEGPAGASIFGKVGRLYQTAGHIAAQHAQGKTWPQAVATPATAKALNDVGGILFHYPAGQIERTASGIAAMADGRTRNPMVLIGGARKKAANE